ncbi:hypothetical protein NMG60_11027158 [Bertholletia excelsa]
MGKAARWFRGLLGLRKDESPSSSSSPSRSTAKLPKKRWSFVKSHRDRDRTIATNPAGDERRGLSPGNMPPPTPARVNGTQGPDPSKSAIAVAAATAAAAEAAVAAAQAAAEVVRLNRSGRSGAPTARVSGASCGIRAKEWAAVKIQAYFRGYLARRALRALKGLVRLQALVRGHMVRKHTADVMRYMQVLLRAQARARAGRIQIPESQQLSTKASQFQHPGPATPEKFEHAIRSKCTKHDQLPMHKRSGSKSTGLELSHKHNPCNGWNWTNHQVDEGQWNHSGRLTKGSHVDDEKSDKILEVDNGRPDLISKRRSLFQGSDQYSHSFSTSKDTVHSTYSCEVHSLSPFNFAQEEVEESPYCTASNSPWGVGSKSGPFTPTRSDGSRSYLSGFSDCPSYMACTESSKAKARSLSAPKQRPSQYERSASAKRYSIHGYGESRTSTQRVSAIHTSFANKAYPGSGRLDRLGMPLRF